ncbi:MAG: hypothetical protein JPMHGGIA_02506 [Saprospiraceae bacterium]|jgi:hypothetical protein|nr:hypothetical protein [Saprospiraceae bacterium]
MVREYSARGLVLERALELAGISRSQYYYVKKPGKPGRQATKTTPRMAEGTMVICDNAEVVQTIEGILKDPDLQYGYKKMTAALMCNSHYLI